MGYTNTSGQGCLLPRNHLRFHHSASQRHWLNQAEVRTYCSFRLFEHSWKNGSFENDLSIGVEFYVKDMARFAIQDKLSLDGGEISLAA